jgi:DNA-binding transcriptional LysR family regulator
LEGVSLGGGSILIRPYRVSLRPAITRELRDLEAGEVVIGATTTPARYVLGKALVQFMDEHPQIALRLVIGRVEEIVDALTGGSVHLALISGAISAPNLFVEPCLGDRLVLAVPRDHPFVHRKCVFASDLVGERLFIPSPGACERSAIDTYLQEHGLAGLRIRDLGDSETVKKAVMAGGGVAFLSELATEAEERAGLLAVIRSTDTVILRQFLIAYSKVRRQSPAALAFAALVRKIRARSTFPVDEA